MYKDNEFQRISLIDVFIFAEEVRLSPMKDMALDGAARLRLAVSAFQSGQPPFSPYGKTFRALSSGQTHFSPDGKTFKALPSGQTPFSPYGNSSASGSVTQNRNRTRSGGTQYSKMTHWVTLEVPRRPIPVTESDAKSLKCRQSENWAGTSDLRHRPYLRSR